MEFSFNSVKNLFDLINKKQAKLTEETDTIEAYLEARADAIGKSCESNLNQARQELLAKLQSNLEKVLASLNDSNINKEESSNARIEFRPSTQTLEDSRLFNYDEINTTNVGLPKLNNFLKFSDLYRLRLNEITFTEPEVRFQVNFVSVLSVTKIFVDLNLIQDGEVQVQKRKLLILNGRGQKLYQLDYFHRMNDEDIVNRVAFFSKNRIYLFNTMDTDIDMYQVEIFNFKLELQRTVQLSKDVRHLIKNDDELCIQTTKKLRFYDFDLNFK